jgi:Protein of unknown function (DUF3618)
VAEKPDEINERVKQDERLTPDELEELKRKAQSDDEVEAARANIELTRAEMTQTVDALQDKLDPETLKEQAKTRAKDTVRKGGSQAAETVKQNPAIPLAVGGGLLAVLLLRRLLGGGGSETVVVDLKKRRTRRG